MKIIPFRIPKSGQEAVRVQVDTGPHFYPNLHRHPEVQITLIAQGEGVLVANDYVGNFAAGNVFVLGRELAHVFRSDTKYFAADSEHEVLGISLFFDEKYFGDHFWNLNEMEAVRRLVREAAGGLKITGPSQTAVAQHLVAIQQQSGLEKMITFFSILHLLAAGSEYQQLSLAQPFLQSHTYDNERINAIVQFTFESYQDPIAIETVARLANLTPEAFCRYFKLRTRKTYLRFLHEVRINQACKLLLQDDLSVEEVAFQTGFNNRANFNRVFKMIVGKTPSSYVAQNR
ncbi:MAG: helix-turn-helix domain-containing protein [Saprospiraceae bacterium]|nr:helix-turn-helix domain-containing protein [Saprospiraceae bacterium]